MKKIKKNLLNTFILSTFLSNSLSAITIKLDLGEDLTGSQRYAFKEAQDKWQKILINDDLPKVEGNNGYDIVIKADAVSIDGPGGILGTAGPRILRPGSHIPSQAIMKFDSADLDEMGRNGTLNDVIVHEMAHALGFGTIWEYLNLTNRNANNPLFLGINAKKQYQKLRNVSRLLSIPLENIGGQGTAGSHWKKSIFGNEIMTGSISGAASHPLSILTMAAFEDMGYQVDYRQADHYFIPTPAKQQYRADLLFLGTLHPDLYIPPVCKYKTICPSKVYYSILEPNYDEIESFCRIF